MYIRLAIGTAILSTITVALTGHAGATVSINSQDLSGTQAQICPALVSDGAIATTPGQSQRLNVPVPPNEVLDLTYVCYGGSYTEPEPPVIDLINSSVNRQKTPQAATQFDQLPQDRIELRAPM